MNTKLIKISKWFWPWQDDKEEAWLGQMAGQGYNLHQVGFFGQYAFIQGSPREVVYRLDFIANAKKSPDYFQLFKDAGWEHVGELGGWQYWRKDVVDGKIPEIFTDNTSKIQKYRRLIGYMVIFFPIYVVLLTNQNNRSIMLGNGIFSFLYQIVFFLFFVVVVLLLVSMIKILQRISSLKRR